MNWKNMNLALTLVVGFIVLQGTMVMAATNGSSMLDTDRAAWMLERGSWNDIALTGEKYEQGEDDKSDVSLTMDAFSTDGSGSGGTLGWSLLASAILPGAGEAMMGYRRGYAMMAVDIFAITQVVKYNSEGVDIRNEYYAFADEHYSDELLVLGYTEFPSDYNNDFYQREGLGDYYFSSVFDESSINNEDDLENLNLYVSVENDRREWYENLGKWDQFVFGWDDFLSPENPPDGIEYVLTDTIEDMRQPWISENREHYRQMRGESNDALKSRDRWMYVNIGMRVFSVLQVAYLSGMLTGPESSDIEVAGHPVQFHVQPYGTTAGAVAASVDF